jgi:NAD(P)H dehydrogenase (quinone)
MKAFIDECGGHCISGSLIGKVASFFTATKTQHGGQESAILTSMVPLLHHGMICSGLP